jgi:hypothetical protein
MWNDGIMATSTLLTFEDFERPTVARKRLSVIAHRLLYSLRTAEELGPLGASYIRMGYKIGNRTWLQPDVSVEHVDQPAGEYNEGAPALAVEVISEWHTAEHLEQKIKTYLANGAIEVWAVYPKTRNVWVFRHGRGREFCDFLTSDLIPGLRIDLGALFA